MTAKDIRELLARADRLAGPELDRRHEDFNSEASKVDAAANLAHAFGGSAYRQEIRRVCANELARRCNMLADGLIAAHTAMHSPSSNDARRECKDWAAERIACEAGKLSPRLWKPRHWLGEVGSPDVLDRETKSETERAFAAIDQHFDETNARRLTHVTGFIARWGIRAMRWVFASSK